MNEQASNPNAKQFRAYCRDNEKKIREWWNSIDSFILHSIRSFRSRSWGKFPPLELRSEEMWIGVGPNNSVIFRLFAWPRPIPSRNCFSFTKETSFLYTEIEIERSLLTISFIAGSRVILFFFLSSSSFCRNFDAIGEEKAIWSVILNAVPANCYTLLTHEVDFSYIGSIWK